MPNPDGESRPLVPTFFARIDSWWKALAVLVGAVSIGVTIGVTVTSFVSLPAVVEANATAIESNSARIAALESSREVAEGEARRSREGIEHRLDRLECLVVASRRNTPIEDCL